MVAWNELLDRFGYKLICCNTHTGANCFFVKKKFLSKFKDVPKEIEKIMQAVIVLSVVVAYEVVKRYVTNKQIKEASKVVADG